MPDADIGLEAQAVERIGKRRVGCDIGPPRKLARRLAYDGGVETRSVLHHRLQEGERARRLLLGQRRRAAAAQAPATKARREIALLLSSGTLIRRLVADAGFYIRKSQGREAPLAAYRPAAAGFTLFRRRLASVGGDATPYR